MKNILDLLNKLQSRGVRLRLDDANNLLLRGNKDLLDEQLINEIKNSKPFLIDYLLQHRYTTIEVIGDRDSHGLHTSFAQQRLWLLDQINGGSAQYNMACPLKLTGSLSLEALNRAFTTILERHESLRTCFSVGEDGQPVQVIQAAEPFKIPTVDLSGLEENTRRQQLTELMAEESSRTFDLSRDLMLRALLIKLTKEEHIALVTVHHIASDGWSTSILINEFSALYSAYTEGRENPLTPLPIQYADYSHWQRNRLQGKVLDEQLGYWEKQLAGIPAVHGLPLDHPRPASQTFAGKTYLSQIDSATSKALNDLCESQDATLFMGLQAVFAVLLSRYSNETDIIIGTPIANREQAEVAGLIGFFANTLVLRSDLSGNPTFVELLQQSKNMLLDAYAHQQVPFELVVERLQPERSESHSALFQVMLILQNNDEGNLELPGLTLSPVELNVGTAKYDLTLDVAESAAGLCLSWEYNIELFEHSTIVRMAAHFDLLLKALLARPEKSVFMAEMLNAQERRQLLVDRNDTTRDFPKDRCIHELFEARVETNPNSIAIVFEDQALTYGELNKRANQLAHCLINEKRVTPDTLVGIFVERSLNMVIGILAILKAGGAYVPFDPEYPEARLAYMLKDAKPNTVLTQSHLREKMPFDDDQAVCLDDEVLQRKLQQQPTRDPVVQELGLSSSHLAYVIYTSGSTGNPKGVLAPHRSIVNRVSWMDKQFPSQEDEVFCQKTALGFVDHVAEIFQPLSFGGRLVVVRTSDTLDAERFIDIVRQHRITRLTLVPSLLKLLIEQGTLAAMPSLRLVISSGEALQVEVAHGFCRALPASRLLNLYGSSEIGADVTFTDVTDYLSANNEAAGDAKNRFSSHLSSVPIGKPIANTQLAVLDANGNLVPHGVSGELYVGGMGLAHGYLNSAELTAGKFIVNPFHDKANPSSSERLYKTGDIVRWRPDTNLEYIGRIDHQVKIRGFRVELGEIENALAQHPKIRDAVVVAHEGTTGDVRLQAYVVSRQDENYDAEGEQRTSFSLFYFGADTDSRENKYDLYLQAAKFADEQGFEAVWTPERHFDTVGGLYPNPSLLSAALATTTKRINLRAGSVVLPFHDPIRVAEEWAVVDNLSNGRVGIAITGGWHIRDFVLAPENYEVRKKVLKEGIATLKALWQGKRIPRKDGKGDDVEVQIYPRPLQKQLPLWITAAGNPETFIEAGRLGTHLLTNLLGQTIDGLAENISLYKDSLAQNGHDPQQGRVTLMIHTYLGRDLQQTLDQAREPFKKYMRSHISLIIPMLKSLDVPTDDLGEADLENMVDYAFERYAQTASFIGTPQSVLPVATRLNDIGVDEFACLIDWMDGASALQGLDSICQLQRIAQSLPPSTRNLADHCRTFLPRYMVPAGFMFLDQLPLTPNGKVDRGALPEPDISVAQVSYQPPRNETEKHLCEIWQDMLGVEQVGIADNFFDLGGSSLSATRLIARVNQSFDVQLEIKTLFQCKDLSALANTIIERTILEKNKRRLEENRLKEEIEW